MRNSNNNLYYVIIAAIVVIILALLTGCQTDADVASRNLSTAAEQFEIDRRAVFYNGITGEYILVVEGRCSIEDQGTQLELTCKTGDDTYMKHFLGLSDNVTYFVEQLGPAEANVYRYDVIFKPESIVPDIDFEHSAEPTSVP